MKRTQRHEERLHRNAIEWHWMQFLPRTSTARSGPGNSLICTEILPPSLVQEPLCPPPQAARPHAASIPRSTEHTAELSSLPNTSLSSQLAQSSQAAHEEQVTGLIQLVNKLPPSSQHCQRHRHPPSQGLRFALY